MYEKGVFLLGFAGSCCEGKSRVWWASYVQTMVCCEGEGELEVLVDAISQMIHDIN